MSRTVSYLVLSKFADIDLHPDAVSNHEMGLVFEDLIRRFNEASNETAGDHFTPREVIRLMVNLLFTPDSQILRTKGIVKTLYDPACGTGGMLSVSEEYLRELNPDARLEVFGQDYNNEAFAVCCSDMMIKGQNPENIKFGDSFTQDGLPGHKFDYLLANPPFGVEWKPQADVIEKEHDEQGFKGRFGAGLPRINDGSLLFLMHMISKMKPEGVAAGDRLQRLAPLHRRCRIGRERNSPLDHRERLAGSDRRAADRDVLQHRHLDLHLDRDQPQAQGATRQGSTHQRHRPVRQDAQELWGINATNCRTRTSPRSSSCTAT